MSSFTTIKTLGYVPQFYGYVLSLNPAALGPHDLDTFKARCRPPMCNSDGISAKPLPINCCTYSKERMAKAVNGIQQIRSALVEHNDPYPKNILIVPGDPERVMWIDFDVAITYPDSTYVRDREHG
ncbi:uncharacterized protein CIMG_12363 [Coccidioides immitis RS]|uniref:Protein kinase domain-containing protein n=1 Tax=Coccidioides immitis (strain RS) TaxID=246410 RepID=A0A0D8JWS6_COCIM|nr:uncharacterized protein CIMG_12363 [Coccidioides immitis RS]KJF61386.1 hypothetical protein CIMG_12363 [Coccidioides immitis RS]